MKSFKSAICAIVLLGACSLASAERLAYDLTPGNLDPTLKAWMKALPDDLPLTAISIPGTQNSLALAGRSPFSPTQTVSIGEQLQLGIRAIDLKLADFKYIDFVAPAMQSSTLADLAPPITAVVDYLKAHPSETVLVKVDGTLPRDQLVGLLARVWVDPKTGPFFWKPGSANPAVPTLGAVRGKMVLLQGPAIAHLNLGFVEQAGNARFDIQADDHLSSSWGLYDKWVKVKTKFAASAGSWPGSVFHVNSLHAEGGISPWFAASGNLTSAVDSANRATGFMSQYNDNGWEDFPRAGCIFGGRLCSIMFEGVNPLSLGYLETARPVHVGIVRIDYPGRALIGAIVDLNRQPAVPVQLEWGDTERCLDSRSIASGTPSLVSNPCDAKSATQRWYVQGSGLIRSVVDPQHCVVASGGRVPGSRVNFAGCDADSSVNFVNRSPGVFAVDEVPWLCMEVAGGRLARDTPIQLGTCNFASPAQRFVATRIASPVIAGDTQCLELSVQEASAKTRACVAGSPTQQWRLMEDATLRAATSPNGCITWRPDDAARPLVNEYCDASLKSQRWEGKPDGTLRPRTRRDACLTMSAQGSASVAACVPGAVMQRIAFDSSPRQLRWHGDRCITPAVGTADSYALARPCNAPGALWRLMHDQTVRLGKASTVSGSGAPVEQCLGHAGVDAQAGTNLVTEPCFAGLQSQRWLHMPDRSLRPQSQAGLCAEAPDALTGDMHRLKLVACRAGYAAQRWTAF